MYWTWIMHCCEKIPLVCQLCRWCSRGRRHHSHPLAPTGTPPNLAALPPRGPRSTGSPASPPLPAANMHNGTQHQETVWCHTCAALFETLLVRPAWINVYGRVSSDHMNAPEVQRRLPSCRILPSVVMEGILWLSSHAHHFMHVPPVCQDDELLHSGQLWPQLCY